jgi:hypothetical protein
MPWGSGTYRLGCRAISKAILFSSCEPPGFVVVCGDGALAGTFTRARNIERRDDAVRSAHEVVIQAGRVGVESRQQLMGKPDE